MKATFTINALDDGGDRVKVSAQGTFDCDGEYWWGTRSFEFTAPYHIGSKYRLGQKLRITIRPGK